MTCELFRELQTPPERFMESTRAERAAMIRHSKTCLFCHVWICIQSHREAPLTQEEIDKLDAMQREDSHDPEFLEVVQ